MTCKVAACYAGMFTGLLLFSGCVNDHESKESTRSIEVIVSGDTAGWITPCGCTSNQSGGLARRASYVSEARRNADVIVADAGGAAAGTSEYQRLKFEAILRGESAMGSVAHNLGGPEIALGADHLRQIQKSITAPFVSANVQDEKGELIAPAFRIADAGGQRIALIGVASKTFSGPGIQVSDPHEAVLNTIETVKNQSDFSLVLAYMPEEELMTFAGALPEVDLVIGGPTGQTLTPRLVGPTLVASATNKGKFLVHLSGPSKGSIWTGKIAEVSAKLAEDEAQMANLRRFHEVLASRDFTASESGLVSQLPTSFPAEYQIVGSHACRDCHESECNVWNESKHSHAWETIVSQGYHVDPFCQQCHTTGYGLPGGFVSVKQSSDRSAVGCESCHGPSHAHQSDSVKKTPFAAVDQCVRCHDRENSPTFDYGSYWKQISHGAERQ